MLFLGEGGGKKRRGSVGKGDGAGGHGGRKLMGRPINLFLFCLEVV